MNIKQHIITILLFLTVSGIIVGCASKLTEEQALAESQALSDGIKNRFSRNPNLPRKPNLSKIDLPATKRVGNKNLRLVLLSRRTSLRWLGEAGFKIHINDHAQTISRRKGNRYSRFYRSPSRRFVRVDDPQYINFGNSRIIITGFAQTKDERDGEEITWIYDQFGNLRVVTYEQY